MAKIVYSVLGEGRGHSSRSKIIIENLIQKGHQVKIFSSNKAYSYLKEYFKDVLEIHSLGFAYTKDKVDILKTLQQNLKKGVLKGFDTLDKINDIFSSFKPDLVISDFEPFVPFIANLRMIPILSINHQHLIPFAKIEYLYQWRTDYLLAKAVTENMYWFSRHYFITSFYFPELKKDFKQKASYVGPILRQEIIDLKDSEVKNQDHILVYVTQNQNKDILEMLKKIDQKFIIYGYNSGKKDKKDENLLLKIQSNEQFLKDLKTAQAVLINGGYTLMSEALFLGKPIFSIPIKNQFEQILNGYYLEKLGYGLYSLKLDLEKLNRFFNSLNYFKKDIKANQNKFKGNQKLFEILDQKITELI
jgi:uncharacterized protein (TIGR00661 family)